MSKLKRLQPTKIFQLTALTMALALVGCGGGGGPVDSIAKAPDGSSSNGNGGNNEGTTDDNDKQQVDSKVFLTSDSEKINVKAGSSMTITARVVDPKSYGTLAGQKVKFSITDPTLTGVLSASPADAVTDEQGKVNITLEVSPSISADQKNYLLNTGLTVTATSGKNKASLPIKGAILTDDTGNAVETEIYLTPTSKKISIDSGSFVAVTARVVDPKTYGVLAGEKVTFIISNPALTGVISTSPSTVTTDEQGKATIKLEVISNISEKQKEVLKSKGVTVTAVSGTGEKVLEPIMGTSGVPDVVNAEYDVVVSKSDTILDTGSDSMNLKIRVTNKQGGVESGVPISLAIKNPAVNGLTFNGNSSAVTDEKGLVSIDLLQSNLGINTQIEHKAEVTIIVDEGAAISTLVVDVVGTKVRGITNSKNVVTSGETFDISGFLVDGSNTPIYTADPNSGRSEIILINNGNEIAKGETSPSGEFSFTDIAISPLFADKDGNVTFDLKLIGTEYLKDADKANPTFPVDYIIPEQTISSITKVVKVDAQNVSIVVPSELVVNSDGEEVTVNAPDYPDGTTVTLSISKGYFIDNNGNSLGTVAQAKITNGKAKFKIASKVSGASTLKARIEKSDELPVTATIVFNSITPAKLLLQAERTEIATKASTTITAKVLDAEDATVPNAWVSFSIDKDSSGGRLKDSLVKTNEDGIAQVVYIAGDNPTASNGVQIKSAVEGIEVDGEMKTDSIGDIKNRINLTVQTNSSTIAFGLSDKLQTDAREVYYLRNASAFVTNNAGQPAPNQAITLALRPKKYYKGQFYYGFETGYTGSYLNDIIGWFTLTKNKTVVPHQAIFNSRTVCLNEDVNFNSILDIGEDYNNNGQLEPGFRATILVDGREIITNNGVYNLTTDNQGKADFQIRYLKEDAEWMEMNMIASTEVDGSESSQIHGVYFPVAEKDVDDTNRIRPNMISPFGVSSTCKDPS